MSGSGWVMARSRRPISTGRPRCSATSGRPARRIQGAAFVDFTPLPELAELRQVVYFGEGKKHLTWDYLKALTPLALAIWYMDDGSLHRSVQGGAGADERWQRPYRDLCRGDERGVSRSTRRATSAIPRARRAARVARGARQKVVSVHDGRVSASSRSIVAPYVHPSMDYKLLPRSPWAVRRRARVRRAEQRPVPARILDVHVKPQDALDAPLRHRGGGLAQLLRRRRHGAQQPGDHDRWQGAEVLRLGPPRRPAHRDAQGRHRRGRQPHPGQGREEQDGAALQASRVRHHVREGHLPRGRPDRRRRRAGHRPQGRRLVHLRGRPARAGQGERPQVPARTTPTSPTRSRRRSRRSSGIGPRFDAAGPALCLRSTSDRTELHRRCPFADSTTPPPAWASRGSSAAGPTAAGPEADPRPAGASPTRTTGRARSYPPADCRATQPVPDRADPPPKGLSRRRGRRGARPDGGRRPRRRLRVCRHARAVAAGGARTGPAGPRRGSAPQGRRRRDGPGSARGRRPA